MKKNIWIALICLALCASVCFSASADMAQSRYLFGYILDATTNGFELMTDDELQYFFTKDDTTIAPEGLAVGDAVTVMYAGSLNVNTQTQAVKVQQITMLSTLYGYVEDATANTLTVRALGDEYQQGELYLFDRETADITVGEDGILIGDEVEVAFSGDLIPSKMQSEYVHITVYGQVETDME